MGPKKKSVALRALVSITICVLALFSGGALAAATSEEDHPQGVCVCVCVCGRDFDMVSQACVCVRAQLGSASLLARASSMPR